MATAPKRAKGRSIKDFPNLTAAEKKLLKACREGEWVIFAEKRPEPTVSTTQLNSVRSGLVRFLALGGDQNNPVHEKGIQLTGAILTGEIDLSGCEAKCPLYLTKCRILGSLLLQNSKLNEFCIDGSSSLFVHADGLKSNGDFYLRNSLIFGGVSLIGATIEGSLSFSGAHLIAIYSASLALDGANIAGGVSLSDGFAGDGEVRLMGTYIGGFLSLRGGKFSNRSGNALTLQNAKVVSALFMDEKFKCFGKLVLSDLAVGQLLDGPSYDCSNYELDGFIYGRFAGNSPTEAKVRINWLNNQLKYHVFDDFRPQPWEQVIKVLREMGHEGEARKVAIAKQEQMRVANKVGDFPLRQLHWLYGFFAGYGHEPLRAVSALLVLWLCGALAFQIVESYGIMGPSSPIINNSKIAEECGPPKGNLESAWTTCSAMPKEYTTFSAFWYSADLILPLVNLQQEADWAPIAARSELEKDGTLDYIPLGVFARLLMWFEILFGWAASLLLVAVLGNLVKKD